MALVTAGTDYAGFKSVDLVIEAVFEDLELKHSVLARGGGRHAAGLHLRVQHLVSLPITEHRRGQQAARRR